MVLFTPAKDTPEAHLIKWLKTIDVEIAIADYSEVSGFIIQLGYD